MSERSPSEAMPMLTCTHYEEDDDGCQVGHPCGKPAAYYSCNNGPREQVFNACLEHKCRCAQPSGVARRGTETPKVSVLDEVAAELASARAAHGPQNSAHEGYAVLLEEVDELWDLVKQNPHKTPDATSDRDRNVRVQRARMRAEAIQIAAMAIRFIEDVCDR